jgi:GDP-4-dehydro-6-deoxy-D-mannose reductase
VEACATGGDEVIGLSRSGAGAWSRDAGEIRALTVDLLDAGATEAAIADTLPDVVHHLAGLASVAASWEQPAEAMTVNYMATLNVLEAVRRHAPRARVLLAGSGEIYGPPDTLPVDESAHLRPQNPYAVSKASADLLGGMYADVHGAHVLRARAFNHAGPRQSAVYAIASFTRQLALGRLRGGEPIRIVSGSPSSARDFTDVRDVARAYRLLAERAEPGIYNVGTGRSVTVAELVALLSSIFDSEIEHVVDEALVREGEVTEIRASCARLAAATGWEPAIPLERTLADAVAWWEQELQRTGVHSASAPE